MTERWETTGILAEVFELLTTEILAAEYDRPLKGSSRREINTGVIQGVTVRLERLKSLVLNKAVIRMLEQILYDSWPTEEDVVCCDQGAMVTNSLPDLQYHQLQTHGGNNTSTTLHDNDELVEYAPSQFFDWIDSAYNLPDLGSEPIMSVSDHLLGFEML